MVLTEEIVAAIFVYFKVVLFGFIALIKVISEFYKTASVMSKRNELSI